MAAYETDESPVRQLEASAEAAGARNLARRAGDIAESRSATIQQTPNPQRGSDTEVGTGAGLASGREEPAPPSAVLLLAAVILCVVFACGLDMAMDPFRLPHCAASDINCRVSLANESWYQTLARLAAQPETVLHSALLITRALVLIAFGICGLELLLRVLKWLRIPAMRLDEAVNEFKQHSGQGAHAAGSKSSWYSRVFAVFRHLFGNPQFVITALATLGATTITVIEVAKGGPDVQLAPIGQSLSTISNNVSEMHETLLKKGTGSGPLLMSEPPDLSKTVARIDVNLRHITDYPPGSPDLTEVNKELTAIQGVLGDLAGRQETLTALVRDLKRDGRGTHVPLPDLTPVTTQLSAIQNQLAVVSNGVIGVGGKTDGLKAAIASVEGKIGQLKTLDGKDEPLANGVLRLIRHEDILAKRLSRLVARKELKEALGEAPNDVNREHDSR